MRHRLAFVTAATLGLLAPASCSTGTAPANDGAEAVIPVGVVVAAATVVPGAPSHDAETCLGGCAAVSADVGEATGTQIAGWLAALGATPPGAQSDAQDQLMYHWRQAAPYVERRGRETLAAGHFEYLSRELARHTVRVRARVLGVDGANGHVRIEFDHVLALGQRTHFWPSRTQGVQTPELSGTIQRVGARHCWVRL